MEYIDYNKLLSEFHEDAYEIELYNKKLGISESVPVYPSNTLRQVIEEYHSLIGIPTSQVPTYLDVLDTQIKLHFTSLMSETMGVIPNSLSAFDGVFDINSTLEKLGIKSGYTIYL